MAITREEVEQLRAPFALDEYEVREGNSSGNKIRWFVYIRREAIQNRLDEMFPGEWQDYPNFPDQQFTGYSVAYCTIEIRGIKRSMNGSNTGNYWGSKDFDEHQEKGAYTDAFKRAASMWGMGLNLQSSPSIYTDYDYKDGKQIDWKKRNQREQEALQQFARWLNGQSTPPQQQQPAQRQSPYTNTPQASNGKANGNGASTPNKWLSDAKQAATFLAKCNDKFNLTQEQVIAALGIVPNEIVRSLPDFVRSPLEATGYVIAYVANYNAKDMVALVEQHVDDESARDVVRKAALSTLEMVNA